MQFALKLLVLVAILVTAAHAAQFAVAIVPAPLLNTADFSSVFGGKDGRSLRKDECGQLRAVEFVALPGTVFTIEKKIASKTGAVYRVTTDDYPYPSPEGYFIDSRSVKIVAVRPPERVRSLPTKEKILATMESRVGSRYVWGGNIAAGVAQLSQWYPPTGAADMALWQIKGVDCSGLLYEATGGYTPRNTSALLKFGRPVMIAGKSVQEIAARLQPLDLVVWPGHVLIVLAGGRIIESRLVCSRPEDGVRIRPLQEALQEIIKKRQPVDNITRGTKEFVVRRWY